MNALLVIGHPSPGSFSHAMADAAQETLAASGCRCVRHDLYAEGFDPVQPQPESGNVSSDDALVEAHCRDLAAADLILVFHPNWWSQPPAIVKGWIDRVFRLGTAYRYPEGVGDDGVPQGLLRARHALVFNTSNTPQAREREVFGDPLESLWRRSVFGFSGVPSVRRRMVGPMAGSTGAQRAGWLDEVRALVREVL
ncbi:MAG: NAD(P)H-dependent oxidoreductase [Burkholderiaceae bacterium]|jgi:putative NADPH-quinone reductase|nr:NAD(P)H-dependent oxidoreductase [Burkholderiaceae bacterium]